MSEASSRDEQLDHTIKIYTGLVHFMRSIIKSKVERWSHHHAEGRQKKTTNPRQACAYITNRRTKHFKRSILMCYSQGHSNVSPRTGLLLPILLGAFILFQVVSDDTAVSRFNKKRGYVNPYLFCFIYHNIDVRFTVGIRSVSRPRGSPLGCVNGSGTCLYIVVLIAAVSLMRTNPQIWIGVDFILSREANSYGMLGDDA